MFQEPLSYVVKFQSQTKQLQQPVSFQSPLNKNRASTNTMHCQTTKFITLLSIEFGPKNVVAF